MSCLHNKGIVEKIKMPSNTLRIRVTNINYIKFSIESWELL